MRAMTSAVILLSGGLDSATCLWWAKARYQRLFTLSIAYGQRHLRELRSAHALALRAGAEHHALRLDLPWLGGCSLTDRSLRLPEMPLSRIGRGGIPSTYVPGRNAVFTALGLSLADALGAEAVVLGANALDYSGYPDCRPPFFEAFRRVARTGTRRGADGRALRIETPLLRLDKAAIIRMALRLGVPLETTWSCYRGGRRPCRRCDSCKLRAKGFAQAKVQDPAL